MNRSIGLKLKDARESRDLTQQELANMSGITQSYIGKVEGHKVAPSVKTIHKIANALGVNPGYFLQDENINNLNILNEIPADDLSFILNKDNWNWITYWRELNEEGYKLEKIKQLIKLVSNLKD